MTIFKCTALIARQPSPRTISSGVCVCAPVCACSCVHLDVSVWWSEDNFKCCPLGTTHLFIEAGSLIGLKLIKLAGLPGQRAQRIHFSVSLMLGIREPTHLTFFTQALGTKLSFLLSLGKHFNDGDDSLLPRTLENWNSVPGYHSPSFLP